MSETTWQKIVAADSFLRDQEPGTTVTGAGGWRATRTANSVQIEVPDVSAQLDLGLPPNEPPAGGDPGGRLDLLAARNAAATAEPVEIPPAPAQFAAERRSWLARARDWVTRATVPARLVLAWSSW